MLTILLPTVSFPLPTVDTRPDLHAGVSRVVFVVADVSVCNPDTVVVSLVDSDVPLSSLRWQQK